MFSSFLLLGLLCFAFSGHANSTELSGDRAEHQQWNFRVFVDDKEVGTHLFRIDDINGQQHLSSVADFEYKLMFVTLYDYLHQNKEVWKDGCLFRIESSTDANGKPYAVLGEQQQEGFVVEGTKGRQVLDQCVMSFAYWNPEFLKASKLLNTQNGEYLEIKVSEPRQDLLKVQGETVEAERYQLTAGKLDLQIWYSASGDWLGLESQTENGRTLRYELMQLPVSEKVVMVTM